MGREKDLWTLVVGQAYSDAFAPTAGTSVSDQSQALCFLLDTTGPWAARRDEVASYLDGRGDAVRDLALRVLNGQADIPGLNGRQTVNLERARRIRNGDLEMPEIEPEEIEPATEKERPPARSHPSFNGHWLCFKVREDGTLVLPKDSSLKGIYDGLPLPNGSSFMARTMRALTRPYGASLASLRIACAHWPDIIPDLCSKYDLELVVKMETVEIEGGGIEVIDGETKAHLRRRLPPAS
ncbi:hypothetical protein [Roseovarius sp. MBR-6]|jgi:hypothetical protein|uniref:hypothetical protein n=1 Tax=Roseovarius sp. MBR-6 TaxID=3156459 RepID=UPI003391E52E